MHDDSEIRDNACIICNPLTLLKDHTLCSNRRP